MATTKLQGELRMAWYAVWLLYVAGFSCKHLGIRIPHRWVCAVTNRSWRLCLSDGKVIRFKIDNTGGIIP